MSAKMMVRPLTRTRDILRRMNEIGNRHRYKFNMLCVYCLSVSFALWISRSIVTGNDTRVFFFLLLASIFLGRHVVRANRRLDRLEAARILEREKIKSLSLELSIERQRVASFSKLNEANSLLLEGDFDAYDIELDRIRAEFDAEVLKLRREQ